MYNAKKQTYTSNFLLRTLMKRKTLQGFNNQFAITKTMPLKDTSTRSIALKAHIKIIIKKKENNFLAIEGTKKNFASPIINYAKN